jgi:DNA polymerase-3 subunit epsilon
MVLIIDTETTGLRGIPKDRVLEMGIAEYDEVSGNISPVYSEMIRYDDIVEFDSKYVNPDGSQGIWIYRNSDMRLEDTLNAAKDLDTVVREVREIVSGKEVTSYNVGFDFGKFLYQEPWDIRNLSSTGPDVN